MPANYTHYRFAGDVLSKLPKDVADKITDKSLYLIGCHGPDILFFYKGYKTNKVNTIGFEMHKEVARDFFQRARNLIETSSCTALARSYIAGFVTHFALDSSCHGYVNSLEKQGISHMEIEMQFDRMLMEMDKLDPVRYNNTSHIEDTMRNAGIIAPFFGLDSIEVRDSLRWMKRVAKLFIAPGKGKRRILNAGLSIAGKQDLKSMVSSFPKNPQCDEGCQHLMQLYNDSIEVAVRLLTNFFSEEDLSYRFDTNYDQ